MGIEAYTYSDRIQVRNIAQLGQGGFKMSLALIL